MLSPRRFTLLLLIAAALLKASHGQDGRSRSSRRDAEGKEDTTYVFDRAQALEDICDKTEQWMFDDILTDLDERTGIWNLEMAPEIFKKPVISKSQHHASQHCVYYN